MSDRVDIGALGLPDDLKELDEELSSIQYEERPSFGPELLAELERVWERRPGGRAWPVRHLAAAALAGLLLTGASVPSARASLVGFWDALGGPVALEEVPRLEALALPALAELPFDEPPVMAAVLPVVPAAVAVEPVGTRPTLAPRMLDRDRAEALLEQAYPVHLQREGVGGVVWLRVWVDDRGTAALSSVSRGSGLRDLDRAALDVAPLLRFDPALQNGAPVAAWIEFPVLFEPEAVDAPVADRMPTEDPFRLPAVDPDERWEYDQPLDPATLADWTEEPARGLSGTEAALVEALGNPVARRNLGPVQAILTGIAPEGRAPMEWRAAASALLEDAVERAESNPAPLLALGRIRLRQGLRTDARILFERGLQMTIGAGAGDAVSPSLVADLHYERGRLIRERWLSSRAAGRVRASAFDGARCPSARSSGGAASGFASVERLVAWNYLCPSEMRRVFDRGFEESGDGLADLSLTMASFRAAVAAEPGHVPSNVGLLTALVEEGRWEDALAGARRFARRSGGHPYGLLIAGIALHELGRAEEAESSFRAALARLPQAEAEEIRDLTHVIDPGQAAEYRRLWGAERDAWERSYWATRDRMPATSVNEREVEHLARASHALLRFGGSTSDAGEIWVRFGSPVRIHVVDGGAGQLTEFWDYGSGPDITFARWVASQALDLTPEGRAYVDDLGKIFPPQ